MAISPINVATKGYLDTPLAVAVDAYLGGLIPDFPSIPWLGGVEVLYPVVGVGKVVARIGLTLRAFAWNIDPVSTTRDIITRGEPGVEVTTEETGHE
jgi:hypothetical protein